MKVLLALMAVAGLILLYAAQPKYENKSVKEIAENCAGLVETSGVIAKTFYSNKGNYIGLLSDSNASLLILLNGSFFAGDTIQVTAKASEYSGQCWLFPEKTTLS